MFLIPNAVIWIINKNITETSIASNALILIYTLRMAIYNFSRHEGECWRFQNMREDMMKKGIKVYYVLSYLQIYFVQSIIQIIICCPVLFLSIFSTPGFNEQSIAGVVIASLGLTFETVADIQLFMFKKDAQNKGQFMKEGLWRYSRHPNFFGESIFWLGLFINACSIHNGWITFFSPVIITLLVRYVSGVPLLEKEFAKRPGFKTYESETNCFIPWFPKEI